MHINCSSIYSLFPSHYFTFTKDVHSYATHGQNYDLYLRHAQKTCRSNSLTFWATKYWKTLPDFVRASIYMSVKSLLYSNIVWNSFCVRFQLTKLAMIYCLSKTLLSTLYTVYWLCLLFSLLTVQSVLNYMFLHNFVIHKTGDIHSFCFYFILKLVLNYICNYCKWEQTCHTIIPFSVSMLVSADSSTFPVS